MGKTITEKIVASHIVSGSFIPGSEIGIRIDQTLTQDATGTMAYLQFESMNIRKVRTELSVSYIDHNTIQAGFENADDHRYLESIARKFGIYLSRAGNGICHQVHLERFGKPGKTLLGADSHTPTGGALDANEVIELRWFPVGEIRQLITRNAILDGLSLTALMWALEMGVIA